MLEKCPHCSTPSPNLMMLSFFRIRDDLLGHPYPQQPPLSHQAFPRFVNDLTVGKCDGLFHALCSPLTALPNQVPTLKCLVSPLLGTAPTQS